MYKINDSAEVFFIGILIRCVKLYFLHHKKWVKKEYIKKGQNIQILRKRNTFIVIQKNKIMF